MSISRLFLLVVIASTLFIAANGQGNPQPNISGSWLMDKSKDNNEQPAEVELQVEYKEPELKIKRRIFTKLLERTEVFVYFTDGRGETNTDNGVSIVSKTKLDGTTFVISSSRAIRMGGDKVDSSQVERWQLSKDGNLLTETIAIRLTPTTPNAQIFPNYRETKRRFVRKTS